MTESDLPGAGRVLGNVFSHIGQRLEALLNGIAERKGLGPSAIIERVERRVQVRQWRSRALEKGHEILYTEQELNDQRKDLRRLIHYAKLVLRRFRVCTSKH